MYERPNKKISVFQVTGLNRHTCVVVFIFFFEKSYLMHIERHFAFQNAWNDIFSQKT